ncbi:hypothetical protein MAR_037176, partial [Mya arenaria]
ELIDILENFDVNKSTSMLCFPLCMLFSCSINIGVYPEIWKLAHTFDRVWHKGLLLNVQTQRKWNRRENARL